MRSRTARRRFGVLTLLVAFVAAQLVGFAHLSAERHEVCDEHGELVHADGHAVVDPAPTPGSPALAPQVAGEHHEHCGLLPFVRETARPHVAVADVVGPASRAVRGLVPHIGGVERSIPLLLQAPKQSPPA
jgi:hypothetical protein